MKNSLVATFVLSTVVAVYGPATAQGEAPQTTNTKLEVRQTGGNLGGTLKQLVDAADGAMWIGYEVDEIAGSEDECCDSTVRGGNGRTGGTFNWKADLGKATRRVRNATSYKIGGWKAVDDFVACGKGSH